MKRKITTKKHGTKINDTQIDNEIKKDLAEAKSRLSKYQFEYLPLFDFADCYRKLQALIHDSNSTTTLNNNPDLSNFKNIIKNDRDYMDITFLLICNTVVKTLQPDDYCLVACNIIAHDINRIRKMLQTLNTFLKKINDVMRNKEMIKDLLGEGSEYCKLINALQELPHFYTDWLTSNKEKQPHFKEITILETLLNQFEPDIIPPFMSANESAINETKYKIPSSLNHRHGLSNDHDKYYVLKNAKKIPKIYLRELYTITYTHYLLLRNLQRWHSGNWTKITRHKDALQNCFWSHLLTSSTSQKLVYDKDEEYLVFTNDELFSYKKEISLFASILVCESAILLGKGNPEHYIPCVLPHKKLLMSPPKEGHYCDMNTFSFFNPYYLAARLQALNQGHIIMRCPLVLGKAREAFNQSLNGSYLNKKFNINLKELCANCKHKYDVDYGAIDTLTGDFVTSEDVENDPTLLDSIEPVEPFDLREKYKCDLLDAPCEYEAYRLPFELSDRDIAALLLLPQNDNVTIGRLRNGTVATQAFVYKIEKYYAEMPYTTRIFEYRETPRFDDFQSVINGEASDIMYSNLDPFTSCTQIVEISTWANNFTNTSVKKMQPYFKDLDAKTDEYYHIKNLVRKLLTHMPYFDETITYPSIAIEILKALTPITGKESITPSKLDKIVRSVISKTKRLKKGKSEPQCLYVSNEFTDFIITEQDPLTNDLCKFGKHNKENSDTYPDDDFVKQLIEEICHEKTK